MINKFSFFNWIKHFSSGIFQNYLVFILAKRHIKYFSGTTNIDSWKCNKISEGNFENKTKSDSKFTPTFIDHHLLPEIDFDRHCLINNNMSIPKAVTNLYISYTLTQ